ncbi:MAG: hypothetical protein OHK0039_25100 [Bacteroidia bacterium]
MTELSLTRAREARAAIERLYIEMRHIFNSGAYKHLGAAGEVLTDALFTLSPEIYGSMSDPDKVELAGLVYVIDRLPKGIEECRYLTLVSAEGLGQSQFEVIIPVARRRNCYRIDADNMFIEVTRGRSEIYDILTHLTFLYIEAEKIKQHVLDEAGRPSMEWQRLEAIVKGEIELDNTNREVALTYLSLILGQTFEETRHAWERLEQNPGRNNGLFQAIYWLGKLAIDEEREGKERMVRFSPTLRERIGHHIYGERWAERIKQFLWDNKLFDRPLHLISANLHSVMNTLFAFPALRKLPNLPDRLEDLALLLSRPENQTLRERVSEYAGRHGMYRLDDPSGTNISVQIFDTLHLHNDRMPPEVSHDLAYIRREKPVLIVMDYAFGEQAYETMDELLKPYEREGQSHAMQVASISVMGKAGILEGGKGDIMVPDAHIFEGTADNYPLKNDFTLADFADQGVYVCAGPMITVLGTSLQNRDVLAYFRDSSWRAIGLEMEGAHYQKAIQAAALIRKSIQQDVILRYAYYASDNPLETGSTLASGSLGAVGVKPTYLITTRILSRILAPSTPVAHDAALAAAPSAG